ncbi:retrovirus-related pol polyprotein from transposon TNT 1-94 [Tanacetum coccineum]
MEAVDVPQTLEYRGGQLNATPVLEVENFTNWKKRFICHIIGIEPQFENNISNGPFIPMTDGQRKPERQWTADERKAANLDQFSSAKATDQTECHKCGRKGYFTRDCWSKTSVPSYQSPFQPKLLYSSKHKPELRRIKDFEAKYNKDEEEVSADDNEVTEVKALMALTDEERVSVGKESANNGEWLKISIQKVHTLLEMEDNNDRKSFLDYFCIDLNYVKEQRKNLLSKHRNLVHELNTCKEQLLVLKQAKLDLFTMQHVNTEILKDNQNLRNELKELTSITEAWLNSSNKVSITGSNKPKLSKIEDSTLSIHDTGKHPLPPLEKMIGAEPVSKTKTIKSILKLKSTFKAETLKGIIINESSSALARVNKSSLASKTNLALAGKFKNVKMEDDPPLAIVIKELNELKLQISKKKSSYSKNKNAQQHHTGQGESSSRSIPSRPSVSFPSCIHCGYNDHHSNDCLYYPTYEICGSYDHDTHAMFIPHQITMTLSGLGKEKLFKLRMLSLSKQAPGVVKPEIRGNVNFEIKSQFMRELREDTFSGNKDEDAHDHIDRVLNIVGLFNIPRVSKDAVMLRVFPFTLTGSAKRWVDRLALGTINTWDLLKKAFIQRYYPPSITAKQLEDIHNFKQEGDKSLYQA